jgi:hypothetical protein
MHNDHNDSRLEIPPTAAATPSYRTQSEDTSAWADHLLFEQLRALDPRETVERIHAACRMMDQLLLAGLRREHPDANEDELELRAAALKYGVELVERLTGRTVPHS